MPEQQLFEYAVIRIVPKVEREEFMNVGVVLYCARQKYLSAKVCFHPERLMAFASGLDINELHGYLLAFENICAGNKAAGGPIAALPAGERFRWLTATRSTVVQTSKVHPAFYPDAATALTRLYTQLVM
jgi:hypothetical protein